MVNIFNLKDRVLRWLMKSAGVRPEPVVIEPGTVMNFWIPSRKSNKSKPALVFLHGFAGNAILTWQFQVFRLAKTYDLYVPDFIFFGDSTTDRPERSPEFQAECVTKGLKNLGVDKCILVGFSYGVMVGFRMAELYPNLVEAMVATSSPMALTESVSSGSLEKIGFKSWSDYLIPKSANGVRLLLQIGTYKLPPIPDWVFRHYLEAMVVHRKERAELLDALIVPDENFSITQYPQRMHIIWGQNDHIFDPQIAHNLKEQLGGKATVDVIDKAGHLVQMERPCVYNKCLEDFLHSLLENRP